MLFSCNLNIFLCIIYQNSRKKNGLFASLLHVCLELFVFRFACLLHVCLHVCSTF